MKYISSIFHTGAVRKTPARIIRKILSEIDPRRSTHIIEFGAGNGEITLPLLKQRRAEAQGSPPYFAFEIDEKFATALHTAEPDLVILKEDALNFSEFLPGGFRADYIICSIPLSFYPKQKIAHFIDQQRDCLKEGGKIIVLFHAFWIIRFLKKQLPGAILQRFATIPPYFLLVYKK